MIVAGTLDDKAVLGNVGATTSFSIKATAKSFSILSSSLYSNKFKAIVQELGANAKDSHKEAGKEDVPFEVHLPTTFAPHFHIRDFGVGLDHDQVVSLYTTYFASTKSNSNDYVGALGLGSKTPFSYTSNFTVTAIKNGRQGIYTAYINDDGIPSISLMSESNTDEGNGVEISFAVASMSDMASFANEAKTVFQYFSVLPTMSGNVITINKISFIDTIVPGIHLTNKNHSVALMGNICYPIDHSQFSQDPSSPVIITMLKCGLAIEFNIGELDIQANREGLSYIKLTNESIKNKLFDLKSQLGDVFELEMSKIDNMWERAMVCKTKQYMSLWNPIVQNYLKTHEFPICEHKLGTVYFKQSVLSKFNLSLVVWNKKCGTTHSSKMKGSVCFVDGVKDTSYSLEFHNKNIIVLDDIKRGTTTRVRYNLRIIHPGGNTIQAFVFSVLDPNLPADFDGFLTFFHNPPFVKKASELELAPIVKSNNKKTVVDIVKLTRVVNYKTDGRVVWQDVLDTFDDFDDTKKYYYIPLNNCTPTIDHAFFNNLEDLYINLTQCRIASVPTNIYGIRKHGMEEVLTLPNWFPLDQYLKECVNNITTYDVETIVTQNHWDNNAFKHNQEVLPLINDSNSPFKLMLTLIKSIGSTNNAALYKFNNVVNAWGDPATILQIEEWKKEHEQKFQDIYKRYPLLETVSNRYHYVPANTRADYINMIDEYYQLKSKEALS